MEFREKLLGAVGGMKEDDDADTAPWNPMEAEFQSVLNFGFSSNYLTSALVLGGIEAEGAYSSIHDVPCEFHDGKGKCFKGRHCVKFHPVDGQVNKSTRPAALDKSVHYANMMPTALKVLPARGTQFVAKICHIKSPLEFYIIPTNRFTCLSKIGQPPDYYDPVHIEPITVMQELDELVESMNKYMEAKKRNFQVPEYQQGQLVAVKTQVALMGMPQTHRHLWFRGIVEEKVEYDKKKPYANPKVKVQLVDFGSRVIAPLHEVASLPLKYVHQAPLAFKCDLDNLIPVGSVFSSEAIGYFKSIVMNKEVVVKFKERREDERDDDTDNKLSFCDLNLTYSVDIRLKDFSQRQVGIGQQLCEKGYGIMAHPFPRRPWILKNYPISLAGANLLAGEPGVKLQESFKDVMYQERQRIFDVITRQDGYFTERFAEGTDEPILMKFPREYARPGVPVLPELGIQLPQRVIIPEPKTTPRPCIPGGDDQSDEDSLELFQDLKI